MAFVFLALGALYFVYIGYRDLFLPLDTLWASHEKAVRAQVQPGATTPIPPRDATWERRTRINGRICLAVGIVMLLIIGFIYVAIAARKPVSPTAPSKVKVRM